MLKKKEKQWGRTKENGTETANERKDCTREKEIESEKRDYEKEKEGNVGDREKKREKKSDKDNNREFSVKETGQEHICR